MATIKRRKRQREYRKGAGRRALGQSGVMRALDPVLVSPIDITHHCPREPVHAELRFGVKNEVFVVQVFSPIWRGHSAGDAETFEYEYPEVPLLRDMRFRRWASVRLGVSPDKLAHLILKHAPKN